MMRLVVHRPFTPSLFYGRPMGAHLGQEFEDIFDVDRIRSGIFDLLDQFPEGALKETDRVKLAECERILERDSAADLLRGGKCLYDLFQEVKESLRGEQARPPVRLPPPPGAFPIIPVLIGVGGLGVAAVIYFVTRK
jgi:hypothetical protein